MLYFAPHNSNYLRQVENTNNLTYLLIIGNDIKLMDATLTVT